MRAGRIHQIGPPREVYEYPGSRMVADFIGAANLLDGEVTGAADGLVTIRLAATGTEVVAESTEPLAKGQSVSLMVRPEKIEGARQPAGGPNQLSGTILDIAYLGDLSIYHVAIAEGVKTQVAMPNRRHQHTEPFTWNDTIHLSWHPGDAVILTA